MNNRIIGGEFDINPILLCKKKEIFENAYLYSCGRAALFEILKSIKILLGINKIFLPEYLCHSIVDVANDLNYIIKFYRLNDQLSFQKDSFEKEYIKNSVVLIINYFGVVDSESDVEYIKSIDKTSIVILDNVQAFFEMHKPTKADFSFSSFRKTFPVPDGGWVKTNITEFNLKNTGIEIPPFIFYKILGGLIKHFKQYSTIEIDDEIYVSLLRKGEDIIEIQKMYHGSISHFTMAILSNLDFENIAQKRIENSNYLINRLKEINLDPFIEIRKDKVPLFVPILLKNRDLIKSKLAQNSIYCPVHWPYSNINGNSSLLWQKMWEKELSIVIDQRYQLSDMDKIVNVISSFYKKDA